MYIRPGLFFFYSSGISACKPPVDQVRAIFFSYYNTARRHMRAPAGCYLSLFLLRPLFVTAAALLISLIIEAVPRGL